VRAITPFHRMNRNGVAEREVAYANLACKQRPDALRVVLEPNVRRAGAASALFEFAQILEVEVPHPLHRSLA